MKLLRRVGRVLGHVLPLTILAAVMSLMAVVLLVVALAVLFAVCWCFGIVHGDGEGVQWAKLGITFLQGWGIFFALAISQWMIEDQREMGRLWRAD